MAEEGIRLTQYYIAHSVCSPSRAALLTGRQPYRAGIVDVLRPDSPTGLPPEEITIAEALRGVGYATAAFGKWHLGDRPEYLPLQHGFDHFVGMPYSMDMEPTVLYTDNAITERFPGGEAHQLTKRITDAAIGFLRAPKTGPFFIYFNHTLPHPPIHIPPEAVHPGRTRYADSISHMDAETGRLLDALDELGLRENTLVIFSSDNGPMAKDGDAGGLRGRIRDTYEGGIRVPLLARWPGHIPPGSVSACPAIAYDIFPTLCALGQAELPSDRIYDGQDIGAVWSGAGPVVRKAPMVWVHLDKVTSVRDGKWKLHVARQNQPLPHPELYNIDEDERETTSVAEAHPEVVARLLDVVRRVEAETPMVWNLNYPVRDSEKRPSGVRRE